ncbi:MAG: AAA family ATPase [Candidatus Thiodiazotropha sp. (ex Codakia orbicularis)]|nr:AAA family ATPase [Candidatus Thiodiazotropha taylori]MBV2096903.1 AAA family ATPase [Candidatus Thiodiazotropha sp. (ex Codakia orbicularis)]
MDLKTLHIAGYKNLVDTRLIFETSETPITIIGNNGTGKSNLIEALLHIFVGLYYDKPPEFDFHIQYDAHNKAVEINGSQETGGYEVIVDGRPMSNTRFKEWVREPNQMPPFPSQVFTYYSGTCNRVENIVKKYNKSHLYKLRTQSDDLERQFVFSDISQGEWIMLGLIAHGHHALLEEMGVGQLNELKLTLQQPESYEGDEDPIYWGTKGAIRAFLAEVEVRARDRYQPYSSYSRSKDRETRVYTLTTEGLEKIGKVLEKMGGNLYTMLQALAARKILVANVFDIVHQGTQTNYRTDALSEGEKQLLCVIGGLTLSQNNECLVLLDEPDTHLNPAWSWRYDNLLKQALTTQQRTTSTTLVATHDPILISGLTREQVFIARNEGNQLIYESPYRDPRGQGVANILVSEYFGLPSSLDENTQSLLDERLRLAYKPEALTDEEKARLSEINKQLDSLGLSISFRDPAYKEFEEGRFTQEQDGE